MQTPTPTRRGTIGILLVLGALVGVAGPAAAAPTVASPPTAGRWGPVHIQVGVAQQARSLGQDLPQRVFRDGPAGLQGPIAAYPTMTTFKTWNEPSIVAWLRLAPSGDEIDYWHEMDCGLLQHLPGTPTVAQWQARTIRLAQLIVATHRVGQITMAPTFIGWSLKGHPALIDRLVSPRVAQAVRSVHGYYGWDVYSGPRTAERGPSASPAALLDLLATFARQRGARWGVMEVGAAQLPRSDHVRAAAWWQAMFGYLGSGAIEPPVDFLAWNPDWLVDGEFAIQLYPVIAAVWARQARQYA